MNYLKLFQFVYLSSVLQIRRFFPDLPQAAENTLNGNNIYLVFNIIMGHFL